MSESLFWENDLQKSLKVEYPVIQAPMLGVTTPEMVAEIAEAGGLGSLPIGGLSPEEAESLINQVKKLTAKPFSVNLFAHHIPDISEPEFYKMRDFIIAYVKQKGITLEKIPETNIRFYSYKEQIDILIQNKVPVVSFTFDIIDDESVKKLKEANTFLMGTATCIEEALLLENKGIDSIVVQGIEAGGHRGSFIKGKLPEVGLFALLPEIVNQVKVPVIAAGAIADGKSLMASHILGAKGFQLGSIFLRSKESKASQAYKQAIKNSSDTSTVIEKVFSGRYARLINNDFIKIVKEAGIEIPPYPIQNYLTQAIRQEANKVGQADLISLYAGQRAFKAEELTSKEIFHKLIQDTEDVLTSLKTKF